MTKLFLFFLAIPFTSFALSEEPCLLEFDSALQEVFTQNLEIKSAEEEIFGLNAQTYQVSRYRNPTLNMGLARIGRSVSGDENEVFVGVTQVVELGGKRSARTRAARTLEVIAYWELQVLKSNLCSDFLHAFIDVALAQEKIDLFEEQHRVTTSIMSCITEKAAAGKSSLLDVKKAELACKSIYLLSTKQKAILERLKKVLSAFWNCKAPSFNGVDFCLQEISPPGSYDALLAELNESPLLAKGQEEIAHANEVLNLERARRYPDMDVQVGVMTERFYKEPTLALAVNVPLTIFDRNTGNISHASSDQNQAIYQQQLTYHALVSSLKALHEGWQITYQQAQLLQNELIPAAEEHYAMAQQSYQEGKLDYQELLEIKNSLFAIKQEYVDLLAEYHHRRADILKVTGVGCRISEGIITTECTENTEGG